MKIIRKYYYLIFLLALFIFPYPVFATNCRVVAGSGHDLGDEIACGDEHFYLLSNENNELELFAKYNLYVGVIIHKDKIEKEDGDTRSDQDYCGQYAYEKGGSMKSDGFYTAPGYCYYTTRIQTNRIYQSEEAKSAHWDEELNYLYPQVGDVYIYSSTFSSYENNRLQNDSDFYDVNVDLNGSEYYNSSSTNPTITIQTLNDYRDQFIMDGYQIDSIGLLKLGRLDDLIYQISNRRIPLKQWGNEINITQRDTRNNSNYVLEAHFGDLKPYISDEYKWLYSTTYWNSTFYNYRFTQDNYDYSQSLYVFVAQQGKLCGAGFAYCASNTTIGCGLRPVITMPAGNLEYAIYIPANPNGTVEVVESSLPNQPITFKVTAKEGYKLDKIIIRTVSGEEITFTENDIVKNDDGTISITNNSFTMPNESVTIEARWVSIYNNPETWSSIIIILLIIVFITGSSISMVRKSQKKGK